MAISENPIPEQLDRIMSILAPDAATDQLRKTVCEGIKELWDEDQKLDLGMRDVVDRQRFLSILLPALRVSPSAEMRCRMNLAVALVLRGRDPDEEFATLLQQPGIPPKYRFGNMQTHGDFAALLLDGVQGEVRQQIIAWMVQGDPCLADSLRTEVDRGDPYSTDVGFETLYSSTWKGYPAGQP